ncbi:sigma-70 family RNA polymerase sigma factor [Streptococcus sp. 121]|uniref:DUF1492 domain-containing protein n=1 Tax=Streptococcus sp. 121 TaxID=2797637 RepID=UPI0018F05C13|nr:DUF1492 domain-containing protein [Streptococcus sp. 121]MBJ6745432.1 sigma-70 family RNA polymerase sigma factor [Streptococcus sp. 121]
MTNVKDRLNRLKKIPKRLQEIKREIEYLESNLASQNLPNESTTKNYKNTAEDRIINAIDRLSELKRERYTIYCEYSDMIKVIEQLPDLEDNLVLRLLYVNGHSWNEVAKSMKMSSSTVQRVRTRAIKELEELLEDNATESN